MPWKDIRSRYKQLVQASDEGRPLGDAWRAFRETVVGEKPPYHFEQLVDIALDTSRRSGGEDFRILEHGCGGGVTCLYLLALGYTGIRGVDVKGRCDRWNRLLREEFGIDETRFHIYDGVTLPFGDGTLDMVFSQQVLEHVEPRAIESFYSEEARVLRPGGLAVHQVPHRLVPYDSHTRTWFVHYLPRPLALRLYGLLGCNEDLVRNRLFLRWPGYHRRQSRKFFGTLADVTGQRLTGCTNFEYYDGNVRLRLLAGRLAGMPVVGRAFAAVLSNFVMLDTIAVKGPRA